ncbi:hypothetical protein JTE90_009300 [Oedothorax gibbosus]|uniref:Uncharacterized protein n=1 Tax=Oedothorax gibbosus TaxID=931172 RepID=A0AAV6U2K1_9ARAC|nr:hypothetical protein JTE90_009300 [Oedothorax gibbosus]
MLLSWSLQILHDLVHEFPSPNGYIPDRNTGELLPSSSQDFGHYSKPPSPSISRYPGDRLVTSIGSLEWYILLLVEQFSVDDSAVEQSSDSSKGVSAREGPFVPYAGLVRVRGMP